MWTSPTKYDDIVNTVLHSLRILYQFILLKNIELLTTHNHISCGNPYKTIIVFRFLKKPSDHFLQKNCFA